MEYCHLLFCTNTGAPQGTVLAGFLFSLNSTGCESTDESCLLVKFVDDTELVKKKSSNDNYALYHKQIENIVNFVIRVTCIQMFVKLKRFVLTIGRMKHVQKQSTLNEKQ